MLKLGEKQSVEQAYEAIWNTFKVEKGFPEKELLDRGWCFQFDDIYRPDIVFVGINPSFLAGDVWEVLPMI